MSNSENQDETIISIDLGASGTKVVIGLDGALHQCLFLVGGQDFGKSIIPSILYAKPGGARHIGDRPTGDEWTSIEWFKLFLLHDSDWPRHEKNSSILKKSRNNAYAMNMDLLEVQADYLQQLWLKIKFFATAKLQISSAVFRTLRIHLVMTVPASWSQETIGRIKRAVEMAKIFESIPASRLTFMRETEASAMCFLSSSPAGFEVKSIQKGDAFVVCDCGGLTVDAAVYEVTDHLENRYQIVERVPGESRFCGGVFLDERFRDCLKAKIHSVTGNPAVIDRLDSQFWSRASEWWEERGRSLVLSVSESTNIDFPYPIVYPGAPDLASNFGTPGAYISFSWSEIKSIRNPVLSEITDLVARHIRLSREGLGKVPKVLFLAGRFGQSSEICGILSRQLKGETQVVRYRGGQCHPVSRGAAIQTLRGYYPDGRNIVRIEARQAPKSYGILLSDAGTRPVRWLVTKGTLISSTNPSSYKVPIDAFSTRDAMAGRELVLTICSTDDPSPAGSEDMRKHCLVRWTKPTATVWPFENIHIQFVFDTHHGVSLQLLYDGKRIGSEEVQVDHN